MLELLTARELLQVMWLIKLLENTCRRTTGVEVWLSVITVSSSVQQVAAVPTWVGRAEQTLCGSVWVQHWAAALLPPSAPPRSASALGCQTWTTSQTWDQRSERHNRLLQILTRKNRCTLMTTESQNQRLALSWPDVLCFIQAVIWSFFFSAKYNLSIWKKKQNKKKN